MKTKIFTLIVGLAAVLLIVPTQAKSQTMVVIAGKIKVEPNEKGVRYMVDVVSGATYNWTVMGGTIVGGMGSNEITVNWGPGPTGIVSLTMPGVCSSIAPLYVTMVSTTASLSGQLKYFNLGESPIPASYICPTCGDKPGAFYVAVYDATGTTMIGTKQQIRNTAELNSYFSFSGLETGKEYTLRLWEETPGNKVSETFNFNRWGGISSADALLTSYVAIGAKQNIYTGFPFIVNSATAAFSPLFVKIADLNNSGTITAADALMLMVRLTKPVENNPFPSGKWNFVASAARVAQPGAVIYPKAPEYIFMESDADFQPDTPATAVYYQAKIGALVGGANYLNIYLNAAGDMNASYRPF